MELSGKQVKSLQDALLDAYPKKASLRNMVRTELEINLDAVADGDNLAEVVFSLITWADSTGRINDLVEGAVRTNPGNTLLQQFEDEWRHVGVLTHASRRNWTLFLAAFVALVALSVVYFFASRAIWPDQELTPAEVVSQESPRPTERHTDLPTPHEITPAPSESVTSAANIDSTEFRTTTIPETPSPLPTVTPTERPTPTNTDEVVVISTSPPPTPTPMLCEYASAFGSIDPELLYSLGCPLSPAESTNVTIESFSSGYMMWLASLPTRITVLYSDKTWREYANEWVAEMPAISCPEAAETKWPQMGFGLVWCNEQEVRSRLGAATGPEVPNAAGPIQEFDNGLSVRTNSGSVFVLYRDNTWDMAGP